MRASSPLPLPVLLFATLAACQGAPPEQPDPFETVATNEQALGVTCAGTQTCTGAGTVLASTYRIGETATSAGVVAQTFRATTSGVPARVSLVLTVLRPLPPGATTVVDVAVYEVPGIGEPLLDGRSPILSGSAPLAGPTGASVRSVPLSGSGLVAGQAYALLVSTSGLGLVDGSVVVGLGALASTPYADGAAFRAGPRRLDAQTPFAPYRLRPAGDWDVAFALSGGPGSPCSAQLGCSSALRCLAAVCAEQSAVPLAISPTEATVLTNGTATFTATGGNPPYSFTILSGVGTISGGAYTAPPTAGAAVVRVTDGFDVHADATITVTPPTGTYTLAFDPPGAFTQQDAVTGTVIGGGTARLKQVPRSLTHTTDADFSTGTHVGTIATGGSLTLP